MNKILGIPVSNKKNWRQLPGGQDFSDHGYRLRGTGPQVTIYKDGEGNSVRKINVPGKGFSKEIWKKDGTVENIRYLLGKGKSQLQKTVSGIKWVKI